MTEVTSRSSQTQSLTTHTHTHARTHTPYYIYSSLFSLLRWSHAELCNGFGVPAIAGSTSETYYLESRVGPSAIFTEFQGRNENDTLMLRFHFQKQAALSRDQGNVWAIATFSKFFPLICAQVFKVVPFFHVSLPKPYCISFLSHKHTVKVINYLVIRDSVQITDHNCYMEKKKHKPNTAGPRTIDEKDENWTYFN